MTVKQIQLTYDLPGPVGRYCDCVRFRLKSDSSPAQRFLDFTRMMVSAPKAEADEENEKSNSVKVGVASKKRF
jgi:hypothetical protein